METVPPSFHKKMRDELNLNRGAIDIAKSTFINSVAQQHNIMKGTLPLIDEITVTGLLASYS